MTRRNRVKGMFLGGAIGDALGMPPETMTMEQIAESFGRIRTYLQPNGHKWYDGWPAGRWTDDTQLTLAIAKSLTDKGCIDVSDIAKRHIVAMDECSIGWGGSTKRSIQKIKDGVSRSQSGSEKGAGNGVAMKVSPIGAYLISKLNHGSSTYLLKALQWQLNGLTTMTHATDMALASATAQISAVMHCLQKDKDNFCPHEFIETVIMGSDIGYRAAAIFHESGWRIYGIPDNLSPRLKQAVQWPWEDKIANECYVKEMVKKFNQGTYYVYNSLPFSYAMFLRNPYSIETLYDVVSAGGDTDTNGSMVGALLGALNGTKIFPRHLIDGLWRKDEIVEVANRFCDRFGIED